MESGARQGFGLTDSHTYLSLGSHIPPGKLALHLPINQYVIFFSSYPINYVSPQNTRLSLRGLGHSWRPASGHPGACHPGLQPHLLLPPCFALKLWLSPLTLARPVLFHGNGSLINWLHTNRFADLLFFTHVSKKNQVSPVNSYTWLKDSSKVFIPGKHSHTFLGLFPLFLSHHKNLYSLTSWGLFQMLTPQDFFWTAFCVYVCVCVLKISSPLWSTFYGLKPRGTQSSHYVLDSLKIWCFPPLNFFKCLCP